MVLFLDKGVQLDLLSVAGDHYGGVGLPRHPSINALLHYVTDAFSVCDVTLLELWSGGSSSPHMASCWAGCSGDNASGAKLLHGVHFREGGRLVTKWYGVTSDAGITLSGMNHALQFLHYLVMDLC